VVGRDADLTVDIIKERGGEAAGNYENVADFEGAGRMVQQAIDEFGRLDILVNNAGIVRDSTIVKMSEADFDAVFNVHVKGTWAPAKHAAIYWTDKFKETGVPVGGRIINTTSGAGLTGNFGQTNYASGQGGDRVDDPDPQPRAVQGRRDGQLRRPRRRHPHHRHDARRAEGHRGRRRARSTSGTAWIRPSARRSSPGSHRTRPIT
jgi:hypothetical protein